MSAAPGPPAGLRRRGAGDLASHLRAGAGPVDAGPAAARAGTTSTIWAGPVVPPFRACAERLRRAGCGGRERYSPDGLGSETCCHPFRNPRTSVSL